MFIEQLYQRGIIIKNRVPGTPTPHSQTIIILNSKPIGECCFKEPIGIV
jgi:hypothetical protein